MNFKEKDPNITHNESEVRNIEILYNNDFRGMLREKKLLKDFLDLARQIDNDWKEHNRRHNWMYFRVNDGFSIARESKSLKVEMIEKCDDPPTDIASYKVDVMETGKSYFVKSYKHAPSISTHGGSLEFKSTVMAKELFSGEEWNDVEVVMPEMAYTDGDKNYFVSRWIENLEDLILLYSSALSKDPEIKSRWEEVVRELKSNNYTDVGNSGQVYYDKKRKKFILFDLNLSQKGLSVEENKARQSTKTMGGQ